MSELPSHPPQSLCTTGGAPLLPILKLLERLPRRVWLLFFFGHTWVCRNSWVRDRIHAIAAPSCCSDTVGCLNCCTTGELRSLATLMHRCYHVLSWFSDLVDMLVLLLKAFIFNYQASGPLILLLSLTWNLGLIPSFSRKGQGLGESAGMKSEENV